MNSGAPYYRADLARVHDAGFAFHADACAPGVLALLAPVLARDGLVVELGCGSGHLTRHLVAAGHRVVATDASPAMVELTRRNVLGAERVEQLTLPDDPIPGADAIVSVGHAVSYLPSAEAIDQAVTAMAEALRPGGIVAFDICDLRYGDERDGAANYGRAGDDWAIVTEYSRPARDRFVRQMTVFVRNDDGVWHRDDERHENVLVDTARIPSRLFASGVDAKVHDGFGEHRLPPGLDAVIGVKR
jgi:SAM-dependent methyltransferase